MKFNVKCVRDFLLKNGFVFTVRGYNYNSNTFMFYDNFYSRYKIKNVKCKSDLEDFFKYSGFVSLDDWWKVICLFCKSNKYLYLILKDKK